MLETSKYEEVNKTLLSEEIQNAEKMLSEFSIGTEYGQCSEEAYNEYLEAITIAKKVNKTKLTTQKVIDNAIEAISKATMTVNAKRIVGYENLAIPLQNSKWTSQTSDSVIENGTLYVKDKEIFAKSLLNGNCKNAEDLLKLFGEKAFIYGISDPKESGTAHVLDVMTGKNAEFVGINISNYENKSSSQKTKIAQKLVQNKYKTLSDIEKFLNNYEENKNTGGSGGGSGSSSSSSVSAGVSITNA